jgi:hypothetical protein
MTSAEFYAFQAANPTNPESGGTLLDDMKIEKTSKKRKHDALDGEKKSTTSAVGTKDSIESSGLTSTSQSFCILFGGSSMYAAGEGAIHSR